MASTDELAVLSMALTGMSSIKPISSATAGRQIIALKPRVCCTSLAPRATALAACSSVKTKYRFGCVWLGVEARGGGAAAAESRNPNNRAVSRLLLNIDSRMCFGTAFTINRHDSFGCSASGCDGAGFNNSS